MTREYISKSLHVIRKIAKVEKCVSDELTGRWEIEESFLKFCFCSMKKEFSSSDCYRR